MLDEPVIKGVLFMAHEMLSAGAHELSTTPDDENPLETVARIYTAMEVVRVLMEHMMEQRREEDALTPEEKMRRLN